jgi:hypothetical protein
LLIILSFFLLKFYLFHYHSRTHCGTVDIWRRNVVLCCHITFVSMFLLCFCVGIYASEAKFLAGGFVRFFCLVLFQHWDLNSGLHFVG